MKVVLIASTQLEWMKNPIDDLTQLEVVSHYRPHYGGENGPVGPLGPHSDELAEFAGRLCYESWTRPNPATATNRGYLENIIKQQHFSVLEHASATFFISGVSRNLTHELIRHRHLSFSEVSQRYVDVSKFPWALHPGLIDWLDTDLETDDGREDVIRTLDEVTKAAYELVVNELIEHHGYSRKQARQAARHVLPSGLETKIVVTGNMRAWREVLAKRLSPTADAEFQQVAQKILVELQKIAPNTFQDFEGVA